MVQISKLKKKKTLTFTNYLATVFSIELMKTNMYVYYTTHIIIKMCTDIHKRFVILNSKYIHVYCNRCMKYLSIIVIQGFVCFIKYMYL